MAQCRIRIIGVDTCGRIGADGNEFRTEVRAASVNLNDRAGRVGPVSQYAAVLCLRCYQGEGEDGERPHAAHCD